MAVWNAIGLVDLVVAVALGVGSTPGSPVRFIVEAAQGNTIASLPWILIPGFLVPVYLLTHLALFAQAVRAGHPARGVRRRALSMT